MEFNSEKFELLRYNLSNSSSIEASYTADNGSLIEEKKELWDLGVTISSDGSFSSHIKSRVAHIKSKIGWILRTFQTRDVLPMLTLWKQLVLGDHDYCSQLWCSDKVGDIQSLKLLQQSYLRKINGMQHLNYWQQLKKLKLYLLERRRERYIAIYIWRIIEGNAPNISPTHGIVAHNNQRRGRMWKVPNVSPSSTCEVKSITYIFCHQRPRIFNSLPKDLGNFKGGTVEEFKLRLDKYLQTIPDEPLIPGYTVYRTIDTNSLIDWNTHLAEHRLSVSAENSPTRGDPLMQTVLVELQVSP